MGDSQMIGRATQSTAALITRIATAEPPDPSPIPIDRRGLLIALGVIVIIVALIAVSYVTGVLQDSYRWFWMNTTGIFGHDPQPYTFIMRDHVWIFPIAAFVLIVPAAWYLPRRYWARVLIITVTGGAGYIGGHVLWAA